MGGGVRGDGPPVSGIQVVNEAKALGIIFGCQGGKGMDWGHRMGVVKQRMQKISRIPNLSAFGRLLPSMAMPSPLCCIMHSSQAFCLLNTLLT
jgi:hypothetical protein